MTLKIVKAGELSQSAIFRNVVKFAVNFNHVFPPNSAQREPVHLTFSQKLLYVKFPKVFNRVSNLSNIF